MLKTIIQLKTIFKCFFNLHNSSIARPQKTEKKKEIWGSLVRPSKPSRSFVEISSKLLVTFNALVYQDLNAVWNPTVWRRVGFTSQLWYLEKKNVFSCADVEPRRFVPSRQRNVTHERRRPNRRRVSSGDVRAANDRRQVLRGEIHLLGRGPKNENEPSAEVCTRLHLTF